MFGLYADGQGVARVRGIVGDAVAARSASIVAEDVSHTAFGCDAPTADIYDHLAEQWDLEHPGQDSGAREPVELRVRLRCSLRTWRAIRKEVIRSLCPEGMAPHVCRVPWSAG